MSGAARTVQQDALLRFLHDRHVLGYPNVRASEATSYANRHLPHRRHLPHSDSAARSSLERLVARGLVAKQFNGGRVSYRLPALTDTEEVDDHA